jgi:hypothetical protein
MRKNVSKLRAARIRNALGGDPGIPTRFVGYNEHLELRALVDAGLTPLEAVSPRFMRAITRPASPRERRDRRASRFPPASPGWRAPPPGTGPAPSPVERIHRKVRSLRRLEEVD